MYKLTYNRSANELVMIEYVMLQGVNDASKTAHELGSLLHGKSVVCLTGFFKKIHVFNYKYSNSM